MEVINSDFRLNGEAAATIGFFDGVHAGHRFLLDQLKIEADIHHLPSMAITFFQHPQSVLQPGFQPKLLNTFDERIDRLSMTGYD
jgi:riboflavin kinase/FMN adenylyltransferase